MKIKIDNNASGDLLANNVNVSERIRLFLAIRKEVKKLSETIFDKEANEITAPIYQKLINELMEGQEDDSTKNNYPL